MNSAGSSRERYLLTQLRNLRAAAGALPDAIVLLDDMERAIWFNRAAERVLGLVRPRDRGARLTDLLDDSRLREWLLAGGHEPLDDVPAPTDPGIHLSARLIAFGADQHVLLARDISDLYRLEKVRRDFVANVSHELRTPLTVIHGYLELLDPEDAPELAPMLAEMRTQSRRMGQIVEDLLTLSRLETQQHLPEERVPMRSLLENLRKEAEALSQGRHRISLQSDDDADLLGSPSYLHSAFSNLVSNAVRYTPEGGEIVIGWRRSSAGLVYSVRDTGYGIPAKHLARLSERFYRVSSSRSREKGGTGLGLSIVKHVLSLHSAQLTIDSTPGEGSTFACVFQATRALEPGDEPL